MLAPAPVHALNAQYMSYRNLLINQNIGASMRHKLVNLHTSIVNREWKANLNDAHHQCGSVEC